MHCPILHFRLFVFLGHISFDFTHYQPLLVRAAQLGGFRALGVQLMPNNLCAVFLWSLTFAVFNYFIIEIPLNRLIKKAL